MNVPLYTFSLFNGSRQLLGPSPSLTDYFSLKKEAHFFLSLESECFSNSSKVVLQEWEFDRDQEGAGNLEWST